VVFVIFGASGDLSEHKLLPALFNLSRKKLLPKRWHIVGFSRHDFTPDAFRDFARTAIRRNHRLSRGLEAFTKRIHYVRGTFEDAEAYQRLLVHLADIDTAWNGCSNKLFYLAASPTWYETIFTRLSHSGLTIPCGGAEGSPRSSSGEAGWPRILVEKPFGNDLATAQKLDAMLGRLFKEEQIFRIDHYLAKETLQNILAFRFSNALFEPLWDHEDIEKVEIVLWEMSGVGRRGAFYEDTGALRDVGQNHLLQMLSLVAMEHPGALTAAAIRRARAHVLESLQPMPQNEIARRVVRAQYRGYKNEPGVKAASKVETYFRIEAYLENPRWKGVPFYLEAGKRMRKHRADIKVYFKPTRSPLHMVCHGFESGCQNVLTFHIQPQEGISVQFFAKRLGFNMELEPKVLSFMYRGKRVAEKPLEAYQRLLYDCIRGDQTLFASTEEVQAAWKFITPILDGWSAAPLKIYEEGWDGIK